MAGARLRCCALQGMASAEPAGFPADAAADCALRMAALPGAERGRIPTQLSSFAAAAVRPTRGINSSTKQLRYKEFEV